MKVPFDADAAHMPMGARVAAIVEELRTMGNERNREGMARFGIPVERAFGVSVTALRRMARSIGKGQALAAALWATGYREARLLACFVADPGLMGIAEMEAWARDFDGWEICDQAATGVFDRTPYAWTLAGDWARRDDVWFKRAGFSMMAGLAIHDKRAADRAFEGLLPIVAAGAFDARDPVRKAVSWALRGIGKRNAVLHTAAVACAEGIRTMANKQAGGARGGSAEMRAARWVAADTLRELRAKGARVAD